MSPALQDESLTTKPRWEWGGGSPFPGGCEAEPHHLGHHRHRGDLCSLSAVSGRPRLYSPFRLCQEWFKELQAQRESSPFLSATLGPRPLILGSGLALPYPPIMYPRNQTFTLATSAPFPDSPRVPPPALAGASGPVSPAVKTLGCQLSSSLPTPVCSRWAPRAVLHPAWDTALLSPLDPLRAAFLSGTPPPPVAAFLDRLSARPGAEIPPEHLPSLPPPQHLDVHCQNTPHMLAFSCLLCALD